MTERDFGRPGSLIRLQRRLQAPLAFGLVPAIIPADVGNVLRQPGRPRFTTRQSLPEPSATVSLSDRCGPPLLANGFPLLRGGVSLGAADCLPVSAPFPERQQNGFAGQ